MAIEVIRTYGGSIRTHRQVCDGPDSPGDAAAKFWSVARWTAGRVWDAIGIIPEEAPINSHIMDRACWKTRTPNRARNSSEIFSALSDRGSSWASRYLRVLT